MTDRIMTTLVIGAGRAGVGIFVALARAGVTVRLYARAPAGLPDGIKAHPIDELGERPNEPAAILLAVSDRAIQQVFQDFLARSFIRADDTVGHLSGALPSAILSADECAIAGRFSAHPLHAFAPLRPPVPMPSDTTVMVEGDFSGTDTATRIFRACGATVAPIAPDAKALCHAAAVLASNLPATLFMAAANGLGDAGVPDPAHVAAHLTDSLLRNWAAAPEPAALTGPVARGDAATIAANLNALRGSPGTANLYRDLTLRLADTLREANVLQEDTWTRIRKAMTDTTSR